LVEKKGGYATVNKDLKWGAIALKLSKNTASANSLKSLYEEVSLFTIFLIQIKKILKKSEDKKNSSDVRIPSHPIPLILRMIAIPFLKRRRKPKTAPKVTLMTLNAKGNFKNSKCINNHQRPKTKKTKRRKTRTKFPRNFSFSRSKAMMRKKKSTKSKKLLINK
jgi:hypothetical protein